MFGKVFEARYMVLANILPTITILIHLKIKIFRNTFRIQILATRMERLLVSMHIIYIITLYYFYRRAGRHIERRPLILADIRGVS